MKGGGQTGQNGSLAAPVQQHRGCFSCSFRRVSLAVVVQRGRKNRKTNAVFLPTQIIMKVGSRQVLLEASRKERCSLEQQHKTKTKYTSCVKQLDIFSASVEFLTIYLLDSGLQRDTQGKTSTCKHTVHVSSMMEIQHSDCLKPGQPTVN